MAAQMPSPAPAGAPLPTPPDGGPAGASPPMAGPAPGGPMDAMSAGMQQAGGNPYPTTDPNFMTQVFAQLLQMRQADHEHLSQNQDAATQSSPLAQALLSGSPLGPGAGQDGQGIGVDPTQMPDQPPASLAPAQMRGA